MQQSCAVAAVACSCSDCMQSQQSRAAHGQHTLSYHRVFSPAGSHGVVTCKVATKDGSAVAPTDYTPLEDVTLEFADGETEKKLTLQIHHDDHYEGDEDFTVIFSEATGGATFSTEANGGPERAIAHVTIECDDASSATACDRVMVAMGINSDSWQQVRCQRWSCVTSRARAVQAHTRARAQRERERESIAVRARG